MNEQVWSTVEDKAEWGEGPWVDEPDKIQWVDDATGLSCLIHRSPVGSLCGYVGVPPEHPFHGKSWYDHDRIADLSVHGGVNYTNKCAEGDDPATGICHLPGPNETEDVWWIGFDCGHMNDLCPSFEYRMKEMDSRYPITGVDDPFRRTYKDVEYVKREVTNLAAELAAITKENINE